VSVESKDNKPRPRRSAKDGRHRDASDFCAIDHDGHLVPGRVGVRDAITVVGRFGIYLALLVDQVHDPIDGDVNTSIILSMPASLDLENHVWPVERNPESIEDVAAQQDVGFFRTGQDFDDLGR
jgi:hypothetical protein